MGYENTPEGSGVESTDMLDISRQLALKELKSLKGVFIHRCKR
jgi:hypothetical protein